MRLWHKDLIRVLPRQQLVSQWRECCLIAKLIAQTGTVNHILVKPVTDYPPEHLDNYASLVYDEMTRRGYKCNWDAFGEWSKAKQRPIFLSKESYLEMFHDWHNGRYFDQCYYNLQEKYDRGGLTYQEWVLITKTRPGKERIY